MKSLGIAPLFWTMAFNLLNNGEPHFEELGSQTEEKDPCRQIDVHSPTSKFIQIKCPYVYDYAYISKFTIATGLIFRIGVAYDVNHLFETTTYNVTGKWNDRDFKKTFHSYIINLWSQPGEVIVTMKNLRRTESHLVSIYYRAYTCFNESFVECSDSGIRDIISEAPRGLECVWNIKTTTDTDVWTVGLFGFHPTKYTGNEDYASIIVSDGKNDCNFGQFYYWPHQTQNTGIIFYSTTDIIRLSFNSGSDTFSEVCTNNVFHCCRNLNVNYVANGTMLSNCLRSNDSIPFCAQSEKMCQLEKLLKEVDFYDAVSNKSSISIESERKLNQMTTKQLYYLSKTPTQQCVCIDWNFGSTSAIPPKTTLFETTSNYKSDAAHSNTPSRMTTSSIVTDSTTTSTSTPATTRSNFHPSTTVLISGTGTTSTALHTNSLERSTSQITSPSTMLTTSSKLTSPSTTFNKGTSTTTIVSSSYLSTDKESTSSEFISTTSLSNTTDFSPKMTLVQLTDILHHVNSTTLNSTMISDIGQVLVENANIPLNSSALSDWMYDINVLLGANYSEILEAQENYNTCSDLLVALDTLAENAIVNDLLNYTFFYNATYLSLSITDNNCTIDYNAYDVYKNGICQTTDNDVFSISSETPPSYDNIDVYLYLPRELVCTENGTRVVFKVFNTLSLFLNQTTLENNDDFLKWFKHDVVDSSSKSWCNQTKIPEGNAVSGTIVFPNASTLLQPATISLRIPQRKFTHQEISCGFWNNSTNTWNQNGCSLTGTKDGIATFETNHLTDFALLVTVQPTDPSICDQLLNDFGFALSIISTVSLGIVLVLLISFVYISKRNHKATRKYFSSICFNGTLFSFFLVFTIASDQTRVTMTLNACRINAAIMYTLLLSIMLWVLTRSFQFYKLYVVVFESNNSFLDKITSIPATLLICTGIPIVITISVWYGEHEFFERNDQFCWIMPQLTLYGVVIPMTVLLIVNIIISLSVTKSIFSITLTRDSNSKVFKPKNRKAMFWRKIWILFAMQIVLCFPWVMQYFTFININLNVFHYIFTICNGLQGLWIALLHIYENRKRFKKLYLIKTKTDMSIISWQNGTTESSEHLKKNDKRE